MSETSSMTTALVERVVCDITGCKKNYKNRNYMMNHIRNFHSKTGNEVQSPLGNFPSSIPARVLFDDNNDEDSSIQGNSRGEINSPKVISVTSFQCGACNIPFDKNEDAIIHMSDVHPKESVTATPTSSPAQSAASTPAPTASPNPQSVSQEVADELDREEEVLVAAAKEEDELYKDICLLVESMEDPESENINEKLERLKVVMAKKSALQRETTNKLVGLKSELENVNHNCKMMKEVTEIQTKDLEAAQQETDKFKRDTKTLKDKLKKEQEVILKELETLRKNNAEINKENSDLKIKLSTKESIIEGMKEAAENNTEVELIEPSVALSNESQFHTCNACNKIFKESEDLERHIAAKHDEKVCTYCDKRCSNEQELVKHHSECIDIGVANAICNKCKETFTRQGLRRHKQNCHGVKKYFKCSECGEMFSSVDAVKKHREEEHQRTAVRSKEVCFHWRRGHCDKGDRCLFSHVGRQGDTAATNRTSTNAPDCSNGSSCLWLSRGVCSYFHPRVGVQKPWENRRRSQGGLQENSGQGGRQAARQESRGSTARQDNRGQGGWQEIRVQGGRQEKRGQGGRQEGRSQSQGRLQVNSSRQQAGRSLIQPDRLPCKFDGRCERIPNCPWIHSMENFPPIQGRSNNVIRNNNQHRRH